MKLYRADSPTDLADVFKHMAKNAFGASQRVGMTKIEREKAQREHVIWTQAANMVENTEFVGWVYK